MFYMRCLMLFLVLFSTTNLIAQSNTDYKKWQQDLIKNLPAEFRNLAPNGEVAPLLKIVEAKTAELTQFQLREDEIAATKRYILQSALIPYFEYILIFDKKKQLNQESWNHWLKSDANRSLLAISILAILQNEVRISNGQFVENFANKEIFINEILEKCKQANDYKSIAYINQSFAFAGFFDIYTAAEITVFFQNAIAAAEKVDAPNNGSLVQLYMEFANHLYGLERDLEQATIYYKKAMDGSPETESNILSSLLTIYKDMGDNERGLECIARIVELDSAQNNFLLISVYYTAADIYLSKGDIEAAEQNLNKGAALFEMHKDNLHQGFINYYQTQYLAKSLSIKAKKGEVVALDDKENFAMYINSYNQFQIFEAMIEVAIQHKNFELIKEIEALEKDAILNNNPFVLLSANNVVYRAFGQAYHAKKDYKTALNYYDQAMTILIGKSGNDELVLDAIREHNNGLSILKEKLRTQIAYQQTNPEVVKSSEIYQTSVQAVALLDRIRQKLTTKGSKELLLNDAPWIFEQAISICKTLYDETNDPTYLQEAFTFAEKNKAILLLDALKENEAKRFGEIPDSILKKEQILQNEITYYSAERLRAENAGDSVKAAKYNSYLYDKRTQVEALKKQLETQYPRYFQLKYEVEPASLEPLQKALRERALTLVEYAIGEKSLFIFVINEKEISLKHFPINNDFQKLIHTYYEELTNIKALNANPSENYKKFCTHSNQLYKTLIAAVFPDKVPPRLLFVPDAGLSYIPLETLISELPNEQGADFRKPDYLIKHAKVAYAYSATLWLENISQKKATKPKFAVLAIAPEYQNKKNKSMRGDRDWKKIRENLGNLDGAAAEVQWLQKNYTGLFLFGKDASETAFRKEAPDYAILHLAMHGVVNKDNSSYSGLFFTETNEEAQDDILFAYEIPALSLAAELVVLSACQTGFGKYQNGEGVVSLGRSFMYAGSPALLMTLWEVNDQTARYLMQQFYVHLEKGETKDEALQNAKIDYLNNSDGSAAHPYFWSNFVLLGDAKPIQYLKPASSGIWGWVFLGVAVATVGVVILLRRRG